MVILLRSVRIYTDTCPKSFLSAIQHLTVYKQNTKLLQQNTISPTAKHQSCSVSILTNPLKTLFTLLNQCRRRKEFPQVASRELAFYRGAHCKTICISPAGEASAVWPWKVTQAMIEVGAERPWPWTLSTRRHHQVERFACQTWFFQDLPPVPKSMGPSENSTSMPELGQPLLLSWQIPGSSTSFSLSLFFSRALSLAQFIAGTNALPQKEFFWTVEMKSNTPLHPSEATRTEAHENASVSQPKVLFGMRITKSLS